MRIVITAFLAILVANVIFSQNYDSRIAETSIPLSEVERVLMPSLDNEALLKAEMERRGPGIAPRFAETFRVDIRPESHGLWEELHGGIAVWRLRILSREAYSINLGFTKYLMPEGGTLILYDPGRRRVMGPFTPADNETHEQLWTPVFDGDELVIEVQLPATKQTELALHLTAVNHDFIGFSNMSSGSCNLDVICSEPDGWAIVDAYRDIIQSVAVIGFNGNTICTGFLINNTRNDCTPYFMTADHCGVNSGNAASLVAYWNYRNSSCRQPGSSESGGPGDDNFNEDFNTGAIFRAGWEDSDFSLVELDDELSPTANGFFAGWSRVDTPPQDTVICIHHPSTEEKRISFSFDDAVIANLDGDNDPDGYFVKTVSWDIGTTEGGSSGSPLFDKNKRVVGQEWGGFAACNNSDSDWYGWFHISWEGGGSSNTRLKDWLDPDNTGMMTLDGKWNEACNFVVAPTQPEQSVCSGEDAVFELIVSNNFSNPVTIALDGVPEGSNTSLSANPANPGDTLTLTISNTGGLSSGNYFIEITGDDGSISGTSQAVLNVVSGIPEAVALLSPADGAAGQPVFLSLAWQPAGEAQNYEFQLATDEVFVNILQDMSGIAATTADISDLEAEQTYYWRVRSSNICGTGPWSDTFSFLTGSCSGGAATDVPVAISDEGTPTISSQIEISASGFISQFKVVDLNIAHSWIGDLTITLTAPSGAEYVLLDRPGEPDSYFGCEGNDLLLSFDDNASGTADELENTCNNAPAISGAFQPVDPFAPLIGAEAAGIWVLTVDDGAEPDGGFLNSWALDICTSFPQETTLVTPVSDGEICSGEAWTFNLLIGTGFSGDVTLAAGNVPANGNVTFSENPAAPGSTVAVMVAGPIAVGSYTINISGTDSMASADTDVGLTVNSLPAAFNGLTPANGAGDIPLGVPLTWANSSGATGYNLIVATDPAFNHIFLNANTGGTFFNLINLEAGTTYYWTVIAENNCGTATFEPFSFETEPDLSFSVLPGALAICQAESPALTIHVGTGFMAPASLTYAVEPAGNLNISYDVDPNNVSGGSTVTANLSDLILLPKGSYTITFTIDDGTNSGTFEVNLNLKGAPDFPTLLNPPNGTDWYQVFGIDFTWTAVDDADSYTIEIAADELFTNILESADVGDTTGYHLSGVLIPALYFWRIIAGNECGNATTAAFNFMALLNSVTELNGRTVSFLPNPTADVFQIRFSEPLRSELLVEVFAVNGQALEQRKYSAADQIEVNLGEYPSGVYLVRLIHEDAGLTKRVLLQR